MSMNYGVVKPSFWTGATGRALRQDVDAQVVALYLMTSPHANIIGVFRCPIEYIKMETGRSIEGASMGLTKLCEMGFCTFDADTETVWVHEMARFQIGDVLKGNDKRVKHVARFFSEIENPCIKRAFFEKYGTAYQLPEPPIAVEAGSPIEGASEGLRSPIEATVTVTDTVTNTDTVTVTLAHPSDGAETDRWSEERLRQAKARKQHSEMIFEDFWSAYPLKKSKAAAQKIWIRLLAAGTTDEAMDLGAAILAGAQRYAAERKGQDPKYTKHPSTWLNGACWMDEPSLPAAVPRPRETNGWIAISKDREQEGPDYAGDHRIIDVTPNRPSGPSSAH